MLVVRELLLTLPTGGKVLLISISRAGLAKKQKRQRAG
jgi:hypothetical protein